METMNEQHTHFAGEVREFGLLHEINPSLPFPRLKACLYDDCKSFLPLESNVVDDTHSTGLEELFDTPLTFLPFLASSFSNTLTDTTISVLLLLVSPLPIAQCMGLEMGEPCKDNVSVIKDALLAWLEELILIESYLVKVGLEELSGDIVMGSAAPNIGLIGSICAELNSYFISFSFHPLSFEYI